MSKEGLRIAIYNGSELLGENEINLSGQYNSEWKKGITSFLVSTNTEDDYVTINTSSKLRRKLQ